MSTEFVMPKLGLTMEQGTIVEWLVPDDSEVSDGDVVMLIETDKVETEVSVVGNGRLRQLAGAGDTASCGEVIGLLLGPGEEAPVAGRSSVAGPTESRTATTVTPVAASHGASSAVDTRGRLFASPNARRVAAAAALAIESVRGTGPGGRIVSEDVHEALASRAPAPTATASTGSASAPRVNVSTGQAPPATAAARMLADLLGVDLREVDIDPHDGRITRESVALHVRSILARLADTATSAGRDHPVVDESLPPASQTPTQVVPLRGMRGTIAERMHASLQQMAQLTLFMDAELDAVVRDRARRRDEGTAPGYTDYVIAAVARALADHPMVNAQVVDDGIALLPDIHVGMAVAVEGGLMVPVVRHADRLGLDELAETTSRLALAARDRRLGLDDLEGGTFSVSALGMVGVDGFTPVINPPNVAILGVGRLREEVSLVDGEVTSITRATLSLTWDHRVLDGAPAAEFCRSIVGYLSDPAGLAAGRAPTST